MLVVVWVSWLLVSGVVLKKFGIVLGDGVGCGSLSVVMRISVDGSGMEFLMVC